MASFPTLSRGTSISFTESTNKPQVRTSFEGNYAQTRPKYTRDMGLFDITYQMITVADRNTLKTFFDTYLGDSFEWTNPTDSVIYTVRFKNDTLKFTHIANNKFNVKMTLEEV